MTASIKSVCVYCGSRHGARPEYGAAAQQTGAMLAAKGWRLVYGAGDVGLMGEVARATQAAGGQTFGVIPEHLFRREVGKRDLTSFVVTETMHERKKVMFMNSDAIVVLPGGGGSLDEFFEVLTWRQLDLHAKPIIVLNTEGYWDPLVAMLDRIVDQGFADPSLRDFVQVVPDVAAMAEALGSAFG
ncbi:TIGR00730 family Rossman fold protein [Albidovulum sediminicola]|uniref:Cytokinin riboside 5'-monophosphate phosphoribohydrolase n=1 Tax=Albidovulum sediminicola TaxID=2984331 RepID=A0ABT2Z4C3_9RHOB|nr:TIGR00730 family Rossman fold protein [Defluviimonas sp. WL0075]MCV2865855.1 TIGR00730 family Rossman fold protein [Defluviimonas sp. WL0075]